MFCLEGFINYKLGKAKDGIEFKNTALIINRFLNEGLLQENERGVSK